MLIKKACNSFEWAKLIYIYERIFQPSIPPEKNVNDLIDWVLNTTLMIVIGEKLVRAYVIAKNYYIRQTLVH